MFNSFVRPSGPGQELFAVLWIWSLYHNIADHICDTLSTSESQLYLVPVQALGMHQGIVWSKRSMRTQGESTHKSTVNMSALKKDDLNTSGNWFSKLRQVAIHGSSGIVKGVGPEASHPSAADSFSLRWTPEKIQFPETWILLTMTLLDAEMIETAPSAWVCHGNDICDVGLI
jgi:hypothetical protein